MRTISFFIVLAFVAMQANAQRFRLQTGVKKNGEQWMAQLKFIDTATLINNSIVDVYRRDAGSNNWMKVNLSPITKTEVNAKEDMSSKDKSYKRYLNFALHKPSADASQEKNFKAFNGVMLMSDNKMAAYAGCYFEDKTVVAGKTYDYKIVSAENDVSPIATVSVNLGFVPAPNKLSFRQADQDIYLNWIVNSKHLAYRIYRKDNAMASPVLLNQQPIIPAKVNEQDAPHLFVDANRQPGATHYYHVAAIDFLGNESALSEPLKVIVKDNRLPGTVINLTNSRKRKVITLTWKAASANVAGYNVYRNSQSDTSFRKLNKQLLPIITTSFIDETAVEKNSYSYYVESVSASGNINKSMITQAAIPDITPPAKPVGLTGRTVAGAATINWQKGKEDDIKGYWIYRSTGRNSEYFNLINDSLTANTTYIDSLPVTSANHYMYRIQAVDKSYNKSELSDTIVLQLPDVTAPKPAQALEVSLERRRIVLQWQASPDDDVAGYTVYKGDDSTNSFKAMNTRLINAPRFEDEVKDATETTFCYYVTATDKSGNASLPSRKAFIVVPADTTNYKAVEELRLLGNESDTSINLEWRSAGNNIAGYVVYRKSETQESFSAISKMTTNTRYTDATREPGVRYEYYIRTYYNNNNYKNSAVVR